MSNNLNPKITALNTEKADSISLTPVASNAYVFPSLNGTTLNYDPFIFYGIQDIRSDTETGYGHTLESVDVVVCLVKADMGQDVDIGNRMLRYHRALKEVIEDGFDENRNGIKLKVSSLVPIEFTLMNSAQLFRAVGVLIRADMG